MIRKRKLSFLGGYMPPGGQPVRLVYCFVQPDGV